MRSRGGAVAKIGSTQRLKFYSVRVLGSGSGSSASSEMIVSMYTMQDAYQVPYLIKTIPNLHYN